MLAVAVLEVTLSAIAGIIMQMRDIMVNGGSASDSLS